MTGAGCRSTRSTRRRASGGCAGTAVPADARGDVADAGPAAGDRPAGRDPQAARADVRPLRGAGAADVLRARLAAAGQDGGAAAGAPDLGDLDRAPARGRRAGRTPARTRTTAAAVLAEITAAGRAARRGGDRRPGRADFALGALSDEELRRAVRAAPAGPRRRPATSDATSADGRRSDHLRKPAAAADGQAKPSRTARFGAPMVADHRSAGAVRHGPPLRRTEPVVCQVDAEQERTVVLRAASPSERGRGTAAAASSAPAQRRGWESWSRRWSGMRTPSDAARLAAGMPRAGHGGYPGGPSGSSASGGTVTAARFVDISLGGAVAAAAARSGILTTPRARGPRHSAEVRHGTGRIYLGRGRPPAPAAVRREA